MNRDHSTTSERMDDALEDGDQYHILLCLLTLADSFQKFNPPAIFPWTNSKTVE